VAVVRFDRLQPNYSFVLLRGINLMMLLRSWMLVATVLITGFGAAACGTSTSRSVENGGGNGNAGESVEQRRIREAFAGLSAEDRVLAEQQVICPVGTGKLGLMGTPVKVHVADRDVFICCDHCEEALRKDPDKFLANLK
jgi:hypothetical protein